MKSRLNRCLLVAVVFILAAGCATTTSSLMEAAWNGDTEKVQALLAKGAELKDPLSKPILVCAFPDKACY